MITPTHAPKAALARFQKLLQKKYRQLDKQFLIEGVHLVEEALSSDWAVEALLVSEGFVSRKEYLAIERNATSRHVAMYGISDREFEKFSDTVTSQGIVGIVHEKNERGTDVLKKTSGRSLIVALDDIADPGNLGTIIRTCDWFGVDAVVLSENTVELYNPKVVRSTMGSLFHLPILTNTNLQDFLPDAARSGFSVMATSLSGESIFTLKSFPERCILVFGNEAHGVRSELQSLAGTSVMIPRFGKAESLNVAVSVSVVLSTLRLRKI